jgi:hypothetical protein
MTFPLILSLNSFPRPILLDIGPKTGRAVKRDMLMLYLIKTRFAKKRAFIGHGLISLASNCKLVGPTIVFLTRRLLGSIRYPSAIILLERTENKLCIILRLKLGEPAPFRARYSETGKLVGI